MNATRTYRPRRAQAKRYPNAASRSYYIERMTDRLLCCASWIGIAAAILFLATV